MLSLVSHVATIFFVIFGVFLFAVVALNVAIALLGDDPLIDEYRDL